MSDLGAFYGPNAGYVLELYERYLADPESFDPETRAFFATFTPPSRNGVATATLPGYAAVITTQPGVAAPVDVAKVAGAVTLAAAVREYGHLAAQVDPLGSEPPGVPDLDAATHGLTEADLRALPSSVVGGPVAQDAVNAAQAIARLRAIYTGTIGYDFDHIHAPAERAWLTEAVELGRYVPPMDDAAKRELLVSLTEIETFERFLHQTYLGQKRFSVEGTDTVVPMIEEIARAAAASHIGEIVIGMAHRGRLNVMTHVLDKPYAAILEAFEGGHRLDATAPTDAADDGWTGDVKYHLGALRASRDTEQPYREVTMALAPNPSHLEFVNPVVKGMVRASQDVRTQPGPPPANLQASMAIILHGDAAFPGQGIVAETLNLSGLKGYSIGGSIHIIVNNQIGFTTDSEDARSTLYAGDLAKGYEVPVVHVNADDPVACLTAARLAMAYRERFHKDFLIDLIGYRRWGHNEGDEPAFTQPDMYDGISKHATVRQRWADRLAAEAIVSPEEAQSIQKSVFDKLAEIRKSVTEGTAGTHDEAVQRSERREVQTAVPVEQLRAFHDAIHALPEGFSPSPKLVRQWDRRKAILDAPDGKVDWAHAESLAFAAILTDGIPIRLSGQDAERGTFSQRHLVLHSADGKSEHVPLQTLPTAQASFAVYNSPLSEAAAVGFEYGYSVHAPGTLVLWEAQFGDFANGAQVIIDQFLVAARAKWRQDPALVLLLPHGYEGQGPEHSSGRLERFLQMVAQDNIRVANCTTAAQYFHLLRRQAALLKIDSRPLILMTPKSLLRNPLASSNLDEMASGTFQPVLDDVAAGDRLDEVTRLVLCSGKVAIDLEASPARAEARQVAIARVEQLAPFQNTALGGAIGRYPNLAEIVWLQEEPENMGAWSYMEPRLRKLTGGNLPISYVGRPERASPAEGSPVRHAQEQARIVAAAFAGAPALPAKAAKRSERTGRENGAVGEATPTGNGRKARRQAAKVGE